MYLKKITSHLIGQIAWNIKHSTGSIISVEFGEPRMEIREPITQRAFSGLPTSNSSQALSSRRVILKGEYTLLLWQCAWTLEQNNSEVVNSEFPTDTISELFDCLQGQKVCEVRINFGTLVQFEFVFDLGAKLVTQSLHESDSQFEIFDNIRNKVLSVRGDGAIAYDDPKVGEDEMFWGFPKDVVTGEIAYVK